jgi:hypothetical protein
MAEKNPLVEQMLEHLVNGEQQKAEDLFHEYVVSKSREIYEGLIESEIAEEDEDEDEDKNKKDVDVEEDFEEIALEADPTDDLEDELDGDKEDDMDMDMDMDDESGDKDPEELFQDLDAIVDELQAKFDSMKDSDDMGDMGDDEEVKDDFELETVREYVEKVPAGHGAEKKGQAEKADGSAGGMKFSANNMGGTTANLRGGEAKEASKGTAGGLANNKPQDMKTGNINVPGGKAGGAFSKKEPGHGAEKKGAGEGSTDGQSLFRGRR